MSAKDPDPATPAGYRTLVPGGPSQPPKPAAKPAATPSAATAPVAPAVPQPPAAKAPADRTGTAKPEEEKPHADPTRFGDWEVKGRCIDF